MTINLVKIDKIYTYDIVGSPSFGSATMSYDKKLFLKSRIEKIFKLNEDHYRH